MMGVILNTSSRQDEPARGDDFTHGDGVAVREARRNVTCLEPKIRTSIARRMRRVTCIDLDKICRQNSFRALLAAGPGRCETRRCRHEA